MAKKKRRYNGIVEQTLGGWIPTSAKPSDVLVGVAAGAIGQRVYAKALMFAASKGMSVPGFLTDYGDLFGSLVTAGALYAMDRKSEKGKGRAFGAALTGVAATAGMLAGKIPGLNGIDTVRLNGYEGFLVPDRPMNGFLVPDRPMNGMLSDGDDDDGMSDLAAISMGDDYDGIDDLS